MSSKTPYIDKLFLELREVTTVKTPEEIRLQNENTGLTERLFDPKQRDVAVDKLRNAIRSAWFANGAGWRNHIDKEIFDVIGISQLDDLGQ